MGWAASKEKVDIPVDQVICSRISTLSYLTMLATKLYAYAKNPEREISFWQIIISYG